MVTAGTIRSALRELGLSGQLIGAHASLRSFGTVEGGARAVIEGLLAEGCAVLVPTFSWEAYAIPPPLDMRPPRNGSRYEDIPVDRTGVGRAFTPAAREIDRDMGAIPAVVLAMPESVRGDHPLCSFSAVGPGATEVMAGQRPLDVYAPLRALAGAGGAVVCMGVGLTRVTLLHLAERMAGRTLFRRWANDTHERPMMVEVGGCSEGFERLGAVFEPVERRVTVGRSVWRVFPAAEMLRLAAEAIRAEPAITRCADPACGRCEDAIRGGPLLPER